MVPGLCDCVFYGDDGTGKLVWAVEGKAGCEFGGDGKNRYYWVLFFEVG